MLSIDQIRSYPIFKDLSETELEALASCMVKRYFVKNAYLFLPGNPAGNLDLVESGMVRVFFCNHKGEEFLLNLVGPRAVIGPPLLMENQIRLLGATAQLPSVVLSLAYDDLFRLMGTSRQLNHNLYVEVAASVRKLLLHYQSFFTDGLECRTAALLLHIGEGSSDELHLPVSQTKLASWLGISRGRLNRTLMNFQKQGLIRLDGPTLYILDRPGLARIRDEVMTVNV